MGLKRELVSHPPAKVARLSRPRPAQQTRCTADPCQADGSERPAPTTSVIQPYTPLGNVQGALIAPNQQDVHAHPLRASGVGADDGA